MSTIKKIFTCIISMFIMSSITITVLAAVLSDIDAKTTRIGSIPTPDSLCEYPQGLTVAASGSNNRLFVVQINSAENKAILYMYKDYTSMSNSADDEYGTFVLSGFAGHANAMAIDDDYIYITCWDSGNDYGARNKIARISRNMLWTKYKSTSNVNKGTLTKNSSGVTILPAVYSNGNTYNKSITAMTYYKNGKFIVDYSTAEEGEEALFRFTTAQISNGNFVVSNSSSDVFTVAYDGVDTTGQDIGYDPDCGFFVTRWLGGTMNDIIWVKLNSLSGENRVYRKDNSEYRIINIDKRTDVFESYELESVSIGTDNNMYADVRTVPKKGYERYDLDAIIKIERPKAVNGSRKFLGKDITK